MGGNKGERPFDAGNQLRKRLPAKAFERSSGVACGAATGGALRVRRQIGGVSLAKMTTLLQWLSVALLAAAILVLIFRV